MPFSFLLWCAFGLEHSASNYGKPSLLAQIVSIDIIAPVFCIGQPTEPGAYQLTQALITHGFLVALARQPQALPRSVIGFARKKSVSKVMGVGKSVHASPRTPLRGGGGVLTPFHYLFE